MCYVRVRFNCKALCLSCEQSLVYHLIILYFRWIWPLSLVLVFIKVWLIRRLHLRQTAAQCQEGRLTKGSVQQKQMFKQKAYNT